MCYVYYLQLRVDVEFVALLKRWRKSGDNIILTTNQLNYLLFTFNAHCFKNNHYRNILRLHKGKYEILLYSGRFSRYSAPIHWLDHGHMTCNNETVSRQMPRAGNIAKTMTSNGKQFIVTRAIQSDSTPPNTLYFINNQLVASS